MTPPTDGEKVLAILTRCVAALGPTEVMSNRDMIEKVQAEIGLGVNANNWITRFVKEGRFPECRLNGDTFVAYGRVNRRRSWYGPGASGGEPIPDLPPTPKTPSLGVRVKELEAALQTLSAAPSVVAPEGVTDAQVRTLVNREIGIYDLRAKRRLQRLVDTLMAIGSLSTDYTLDPEEPDHD